MTADRIESGVSTGAAAERRLAPVWWLWLPAGLATALAAIHYAMPAFYIRWLGSEQGLVETLHVVLPLAAAALALHLLRMPAAWRYRYLWLWLTLAALGSFYVAGEEASWGQHYFGWGTPDTWQGVNDQGETNLHNTSSWLDQKPRALLELGVIVGGLVVPLLALYRPSIRRSRIAIVLPPMLCLPSAALAEGVRMSERLLSALGSDFRIFYRGSEVQETFFYIFVLLYLLALRTRLAPAPARAHDSRGVTGS